MDDTTGTPTPTPPAAPAPPAPPAAPPAAAPAAPAPQPKKSKAGVIILVIALVLLCGCSACGIGGYVLWNRAKAEIEAPFGTGSSDDGATSEGDVASDIQTDAVDVDLDKPLLGSDEAKAPVELAKLSGVKTAMGQKRTEPFDLEGGTARLKYDVKGDQMAFIAYVIPEGETVEESGGLPEVMATGSGSDTIVLNEKPGRYFVEVQAVNCDWSITVEEER